MEQYKRSVAGNDKKCVYKKKKKVLGRKLIKFSVTHSAQQVIVVIPVDPGRYIRKRREPLNFFCIADGYTRLEYGNTQKKFNTVEYARDRHRIPRTIKNNKGSFRNR